MALFGHSDQPWFYRCESQVVSLDMSDSILVRLFDGSTRRLPVGATGADLAALIGNQAARDALIVVIDGIEQDLHQPLRNGATVELVMPAQPRGLHTIRHSTAHVLAQAITDLFPGTELAIGPPIEHGFYYDVQLPAGQTLSEDDLEAVEARMHEIVAADQPFVRHELPVTEAAEFFASQTYKTELIERVCSGAISEDDAGEVAGSDTISYYANGDIEVPGTFRDMCTGPHVPSTGRLGHFRLRSVAGAYWRGDTSRPMLQRVYGTAWSSRKELKAHMMMLAEAEKRDHRRLAAELDLCSWPSELGPGLAVWHPKGARVRKVIEDYSRERHEQGGYEFVFSPHIAKSVLWETSGHLEFYADAMFPAIELDGVSYYPKPMNCPFHVMVYRSRQRSYRELPLRLFELGSVYRYELSGVVHGLLRSRGFTQDDSHIFCSRADIESELASLLDFVLSQLRDFGFEDFEAKLSTRPAGKSVGDDDLWEQATEGLRRALDTHGLEFTVDEGGGAFYGPKIDVDVTDAIGRAWQLSTIQLDFNLPERFDLCYADADGSLRQPVMIHRALLGSIERFFGVLLEHYAGALPMWLAPSQVWVLPVAESHDGYARLVADRLRTDGLRVDVVPAGTTLGKRVREGKVQKVPYVLVVGDDDVANNTVGVNVRGGGAPSRDVDVDELAARLVADVTRKI